MSIPDIFWGIVNSIWEVWKAGWWLFLPLFLFPIWQDFWVWGLNRLWKLNKVFKKSVLLEIKVPRNIEKTPKAMENVFGMLHGIRYKGNPGFEDIYFKGEALRWFTCELVGYAGEVHFYIHCESQFRNLVESAIYSEYPDIEITEVEDYIKHMPDVLPNDIYNLEGWDFVLAEPNPYPIKTYEFFEANVPEQRLDPVASITEVMSRLKAGEAIWLQYLIRPVGDKWKAEGEKIRDAMMKREEKKEKSGLLGSMIEGLWNFSKNLSVAVIKHPEWPGQEKKEREFKITEFLSPGEREDVEAIENKISKLGFETAIRFIYIDRRDSFTHQNIASVIGAFRQFNTQNLNAFKKLSGTDTYVTSRKLTYKRIMRNRRIDFRRRILYDIYKKRWFPPKFSILNTEELATIFHFPILTVKAPLLRRLETRKGEPPAGLPVE